MNYALSKAVRAQDRATLVAAVLGNPRGPSSLAWDVLQQRWDDVQPGAGAFGARHASSARSARSATHRLPARSGSSLSAIRFTTLSGRCSRPSKIIRCAEVQERQAATLEQWLRALQ